MTTFVLVPGFWLGAWAWRPVTDALRERGHDVYPTSLTGMAERAHLASPDIDVDVHVTDVVNLLRYEDLRDVVLVGHSYGGLVVTAAADRMVDRAAQLVYVDSGPLPDGATQNDFIPPEQRERNAALVAGQGDGWLLPPPPWTDLAAATLDGTAVGMDATTIARLDERSVPQPWATATSPVRLNGAWEKLPRVGVLSSFTVAQVRELAATVPVWRHMAGDAWRYEELPTWHWPMFSRPAELARILHETRPVSS
jgi:pimeloyl-ACP methyl ester carboxylesterase